MGEFLLQPSELAKLGVILALAHYLATREERQWSSILTPIAVALILAPAVVLIYLQPNLSTALSLLVIGGVMLIMGGLPVRHMILLGIAAIGGGGSGVAI